MFRTCLVLAVTLLSCPFVLAEKDGVYLLPARLEVGESGPLHDTSKERGVYVEVQSVEGDDEAIVAFVSPGGRTRVYLKGLATKTWADGKLLTDLHKYRWTVPATKKHPTGTLYILQLDK